ncbi:MAG: PstS family phosphate ABC transporter substrate-binding protein, partial [Leptolyngbyaceae cyanobacterium bins.59]|nr:PstS family phosphate ABC transporter substrate-binding protein [Leptolyngbyaceae cyanobacterium bins.59]
TRVTVGVSGTGGGFKKFCNGEIDISNASRPIKSSEISACKAKGIRYIELPVAFDALTVVVNPQNNWVSSLKVSELKKMWEPDAQGKVTNWSQVRSGFPNAPIRFFSPGADSGTFDYFTEAIVGKAKAMRKDVTPSENDNVLVQGVVRDRNAIAFFGFTYYEANKNRLKSVAVDSGKGPVAPSRRTVENGTYEPLSRPIFIYVNAEAAKKPEVKAFVQYYMANAPKLVSEVKYVPLPRKAYTLNVNRFQRGRVGTIFGGKEAVGLTIDELMRREARE